jgi:POT family proton-dependent oligopeptide transporter
MWERFSYYGMRSLLILYLTQHFLFSDSRSTLIYGAYTALVYIMAVIGGALADRYLGARKAVTFGAILLVCGHAGMTLEGGGARQIFSFRGVDYELATHGRGGEAVRVVVSPRGVSKVEIEAERIRVEDPQAVGLPGVVPLAEAAMRQETRPLFSNIMYLSLATIIAGVGFLKANVSTLVGSLYEAADRRRDSGFTIFYMGINLGGFLAPLLCGYIGVVYGWKYGFGLAGLGMAAGLAIFLAGAPLLQGRGEPPDPQRLKQRLWLFFDRELLCYGGGLIMIAVSALLVSFNQIIGELLPWLGIGTLAFLAGYALLGFKGVERDRMLVAIYVILAQIPFVALYEQAGSSFSLFTDRLVDRTVAGWIVPAPMFQSLDPAFIFLLAPAAAWLWLKLAKRGLEPSTPAKLSLATCAVGLSFLALVAGMKLSGQTGLTPIGFVILVYLVNTVGELLLVPVSLSAMTQLSPAKLGGLMMGAWFLYSGMSNYVAGLVAQATGAKTVGGAIADVAAAKANYEAVYSHTALAAIAAGVVMFLLTPLLKKWMHER